MNSLQKGDRYLNRALEQACKVGNIEIVKFLTDRGVTDYNLGVLNAYLNNHLQIVLFLLELGADNINCAYTLAKDINSGAIQSVLGQRGAKYCEHDRE